MYSKSFSVRNRERDSLTSCKQKGRCNMNNMTKMFLPVTALCIYCSGCVAYETPVYHRTPTYVTPATTGASRYTASMAAAPAITIIIPAFPLDTTRHMVHT